MRHQTSLYASSFWDIRVKRKKRQWKKKCPALEIRGSTSQSIHLTRRHQILNEWRRQGFATLCLAATEWVWTIRHREHSNEDVICLRAIACRSLWIYSERENNIQDASKHSGDDLTPVESQPTSSCIAIFSKNWKGWPARGSVKLKRA